MRPSLLHLQPPPLFSPPIYHHHHHHHHHHHLLRLSSISPPISIPHLPRRRSLRTTRVSITTSAAANHAHRAHVHQEEDEGLGGDRESYKQTLRLVECAMFASVAGLAYLLSNSLAIENYFGCFFSLPIVISSMRWGVAAGRKTMVATAMLLLTLSGPVKASTYLCALANVKPYAMLAHTEEARLRHFELMHGLVGLSMGSLWRLGTNWGLSIFLCTIVRALGAIGYVLISSFLIRENILALITVNVHASLTYILMAIGVNSIPSMDAIYGIFGTLLLLNCGFFVFLLHILYAVFLTKLGMKSSLALPRWLEKAL